MEFVAGPSPRLSEAGFPNSLITGHDRFQDKSPYLKGIVTQETKYWFIPGYRRNVR